MMEAFATKRNRNRTLIYLAACAVLAVSALKVGIDDNPPGILLMFLAAASFVLAFVHPWSTSRRFLGLIYASFLAFLVSGILSNVFEFIASRPGTGDKIAQLLNSIGGAFFLIAVLLCPICLLVGVIGWLIMHRRERALSSGIHDA